MMQPCLLLCHVYCSVRHLTACACTVAGCCVRCGVCECAWCEDHLPAEHEILGEWPMYQVR